MMLEKVSQSLDRQILKYRYIKENIEQEFWEKLINKINNNQIQEKININITYLINNKEDFTNKITFNQDSLEQKKERQNKNEILIKGEIKLYNSIENFMNEDRENCKQRYGEKLWKKIINKDFYNTVQVLLLVHIDKIKQQCVYQYGMITIQLPRKIEIIEDKQLDIEFKKRQELSQNMLYNGRYMNTYKQISVLAVVQEINNFIYQQNQIGIGVFVMVIRKKWTQQGRGVFQDLGYWCEYAQIQNVDNFLKEYNLYKQNPRWYLVIKEISSDGKMVGMNVMNIISMLIYHTQKKNINLIMLRNKLGQISVQRSNCLHLQYCGNPKQLQQTNYKPKFKCWVGQQDCQNKDHGTENFKIFNIKQIVEKEQKQYQEINKNIYMMKENILKGLDTDIIKNTKCLILGMGTLGCGISRALVGWGFQNMTIVDNNNVVISNPTRQILYTYQDAQKKKEKCKVAAERLKEINPNINIRAEKINIPMPGHPIKDKLKTYQDYCKLEQLIEENDVIFVLTDTRESRWLPTLLCSSKNKILINGALGLNSYLVMRHGTQPQELQEKLGCYFCNDVIGIANTVDNKQEHEKCSITRPGLGYIVAGIACELLIGLLQRQVQDRRVPCSIEEQSMVQDKKKNSEHLVPALVPYIDLGEIPHIIRGNLCKFNMCEQLGICFEYCIGCSKNVIQKYKNEGWNMIYSVIQNPQEIEEISGIKKYLKDLQGQEEIILQMF